jgi:UDP-N-acetylmuramoyl-tripeptide--D-alanyl-D-alanine ligase
MQQLAAGGFIFINDAYNANPYSFKQALESVSSVRLRKIAVLADMLELGPKSIYYHKQLAKDILKSGFDYVFTFGEYMLHLKDNLKSLGYENVYHCASHEEIAGLLKEKAQKGQLIFLKGSRKMALEKVIDKLLYC